MFPELLSVAPDLELVGMEEPIACSGVCQGNAMVTSVNVAKAKRV